MIRIWRIAFLAAITFVLALPEARALCSLEGAPAALTTSVEEWIAGSS